MVILKGYNIDIFLCQFLMLNPNFEVNFDFDRLFEVEFPVLNISFSWFLRWSHILAPSSCKLPIGSSKPTEYWSICPLCQGFSSLFCSNPAKWRRFFVFWAEFEQPMWRGIWTGSFNFCSTRGLIYAKSTGIPPCFSAFSTDLHLKSGGARVFHSLNSETRHFAGCCKGEIGEIRVIMTFLGKLH